MFKNDDGIAVVVKAWFCCQITVQHVHCRQFGSDHIVSGEHGGNQMRTGDGIAVGIAQLGYTAETTTLQKFVDCIVGWCKAGVMTIGGKKIHHIGSLHNFREFAVFWTILQPVAHHLTREGVEVFAVRLVRAIGHGQTH